MQKLLPVPPPLSPATHSDAELLAELVRTALNTRGSAPTESEVLRLVKALSRLQPAALSALASSLSADPENAFAATLQSLAV
jgi:hypothetical protein